MLPAIVLFAKAPVPGRVKTRLAKAIGDQSAAHFHSASVRDTLEKLSTLAGLPIPDAPAPGSVEQTAHVELHTDVETDAWNEYQVTRELQTDGDLGARLLHTLQRCLSRGHPQAMIIGSDSPTLPVSHLDALLETPVDVAFGPTDDGGYYAICCRKTHDNMFKGVAWSSFQTLAQSEAAAVACGMTVERGPSWFDIDEPADVTRLRKNRSVPRHTAKWLAENPEVGPISRAVV